MASIMSPGLGSGIDINGLVTKLVSAESQPATQRLDKQEANLQGKLTAYGTLKGAISALQASLASLQSNATFQGKSVASSDATIVAASATSAAAPGSYGLTVNTLAVAHKLATDPVANANARFKAVTDVVGTGTLTFKFGTTGYNKDTDTYSSFTLNAARPTKSVTITDGSLKGIRDAVNKASIGVNASIINDGTYQRLAFSSVTGAANSLEVSVADADGNNTDASGLSLLSFNSSSTNLEQLTVGTDASVTVDGVALSSESNTLKGTIDGLEVNLIKTGSATLTVNANTDNVSSAISSFVTKYNALNSTIADLSKYDPKTRQAGLLNGDGILRTITAQMRRVLGTSVAGAASGTSTLADIGITSNSKDGSLVLDKAKLDKAVKNNLAGVAGLFSAYGSVSDSLINFTGATDQTLIGKYDVNISRLANQGKFVGSAAANLTITGGSNDTLDVTLDGVSGTVTLTAGTYASAAALAAEVQSKINGVTAFSNAGVSVIATESAGVLTLTSTRYGSASNVNITGGNGKLALVGSSPTTADGLDVAGTIGGLEATGSGLFLTGAGAAVQGLKLEITGGVTGSRGTVNFTRGYGESFNNVLSGLLAKKGIFNSMTDNLNSDIKGITADREALQRRLVSLEQRYRTQFSAMDSIVSKMRSTSDFLTQQLGNLNQALQNRE